MVLLLKPGKDPMECSSYRPIALLNMDLQVLTKVLASRLAKFITSLVDIDQTGFVPSKSTDANLRRVFTHLQIPNTGPSPRVLVSIDIEKAFDWQFMHRVLKLMGFWPHFRKWITLLYSSPE